MSEATMIDAGDLALRDVGRTVTIHHGGTTITGVLRDLRVDTAWISDQQMTDPEPREVAGRQTVDLTVGIWSTSRLPLSARVEVAR